MGTNVVEWKAGDRVSNIQATVHEGAKAVTASDATNDPAGPFSGLIVTGAGTLKITTMMNDTVTLAAVVVGQYIPIVTKRVWSTGTSATVIGLTAMPYKPSVTS